VATADGLILRPAVTLPIEIYGNKRIQEFDDEEADLRISASIPKEKAIPLMVAEQRAI